MSQLKRVKTFNRFDAMQNELKRLQKSKYDLLLSTSNEINKLREYINFLSNVDRNNIQMSQEILQKIYNFDNQYRNENISNNDNNIDITQIQTWLNDNHFDDLLSIQKQINYVRQSKMMLLETTSDEINRLRTLIRKLTDKLLKKIGYDNEVKKDNHKIINDAKMDDSKMETKIEVKMDDIKMEERKTKQEILVRLKSKDKKITRKSRKSKEILLCDYKSLSENDYEYYYNVMFFGTKCIGKTSLLRQIIFEYTDNNEHKKNILKGFQYKIIHEIVSSVYIVLEEHEFFENDTNIDRNDVNINKSIKYFKDNFLKEYNAPFITQDICNAIQILFPKTMDNDNYIQNIFKNHKFYRNMCYFYQHITKFSTKNWEMNNAEMYLIWDKNTKPYVIYLCTYNMWINMLLLCNIELIILNLNLLTIKIMKKCIEYGIYHQMYLETIIHTRIIYTIYLNILSLIVMCLLVHQY